MLAAVKIVVRLGLGGPLLLLLGCSVHPLAQDFSGVDSRHIARQIRCETREAVIDSILGFLTDTRNQKPYEKVDAHSSDVGVDFDRRRGDIRSFRPELLSGNARRVVSLIWQTGIAYNYNLLMNEKNLNDGSINIARLLPLPAISTALSTKVDIERQSTRIFTTTDTFGSLVKDVDPDYCTKNFIVRENILYPLTGKIGMEDLIQNFLLLALFDNLSSDLTKSALVPSGPAQLAEQIEFTTTLDVSATPKITFAPVRGLHVVDASLTFEATRKDLHKLTIGLYVPKATPLEAIRGGVLQGLLSSPFGNLASAPARTFAEQGALAAVNQTLALKLFQSTVQVSTP